MSNSDSENTVAVHRQRRFGGIARLYGEALLQRLESARVCVVGIGGVGSWAVEALARSGVGQLTLIDLDHVAESNINRQLHALDSTLGMAKVEAMAARIVAINPHCQVTTVDDFIDADNTPALLGAGFDYVVDAIDGVRAKVAMAAWCKAHGVPLVVAGAAGGQTDPTRITVADLARTEQDPLLAKMRAKLRKEHRFPRDGKKKFGIEAVYSTEPLRYPTQACAPAAADTNADADGNVLPATHASTSGPAGLNCAGFGSSVCVTAAFGLTLAARVLEGLAHA